MRRRSTRRQGLEGARAPGATRSGADPAETESKRRHYSESLAMLEEVIPGSRVVELLRFELEALDQLPPG